MYRFILNRLKLMTIIIQEAGHSDYGCRYVAVRHSFGLKYSSLSLYSCAGASQCCVTLDKEERGSAKKVLYSNPWKPSVI